MGLSVRIFLIRDDDSLQRFPLTRYQRLLRGDPEERLPEYAGQRVRYAEVVVELADRKPVGVVRIEYFYLPLNVDGRVDSDQLDKERAFAADILPSYDLPDPSGKVVDAGSRFAKKRYRDLYKWRPTAEMETAILEAVFKERFALK